MKETMDELRQQVRQILDEAVDKIIQLTLKEGNRMAVIRLREARLRAGKKDGRIPYGEDDRYPHEKEALEFMIGLRKKGTPYRLIAEALERQNFRTRFDKGWNPGSVIRILNRHGIP